MKTSKTAEQTRDEMIDDRMAREYLATMEEGGYLARKLLRMAREAQEEGHPGAANILENAAREMAGWEMDNE